jgi:hypothetical protein
LPLKDNLIDLIRESDINIHDQGSEEWD